MNASAREARPPCTHCGLPVRPGQDAFCCSGCYLAHHLLGRDADGSRADPLGARLALSAFLSMGVMVFSLSLYGLEGEAAGAPASAFRGLSRLLALALSAPVLLLLGVPLLDAVVRLRRWLCADSLVLLATGAAWAVSVWSTFRDGPAVYYETATMVLVLFTFGRWMDARAREEARRRLGALAGERVQPATRVSEEGDVEVAPDALAVGDLVRVRAGETLSVDGTVERGAGRVDTSSLSGEELPRELAPGGSVLAGTRLVEGALVVRASAVAGSRVRDEIDRALSEALASRPRLVRSADRVAGAFLPCVLAIALGTAAFHWHAGAERALMSSLAVVLIACPCALGLATPLAFWVALGEAWRRGALVRGADVLERLARVRRVFLDKTGTLTTRELRLAATRAFGDIDGSEALRLAAALERGSDHPIGRALVLAARRSGGPALPDPEAFRAHAGVGVAGRLGGRELALRRATQAEGTCVELVRDGARVAEFELRAELRPEVREVLALLERRGLAPSVLTGDGDGAARALARELDVPVEGALLPTGKVRRIREAGPARTLFVGDGLNDAAALAAADVGISMRGASSASLEGAAVNLLRDDLRLVPWLLDLSRSAVRTARANLAWAFGYNAIGLWLAASGRLTPIFAASAMVVSSLVVVLNSARLARARRAGEVAGTDARRMELQPAVGVPAP